MNQLLIATANQGKLREIRALLADTCITLLTPRDINLVLDVEEDGLTYAENAARKAQAYSIASGIFTLGDDSGLEVDVLNGAPGIYSARYAPQVGATDADRRAYLLQQLSSYPSPWIARFNCTVALASPNGDVHFEHGICPGEIIPDERGVNGFGYDPIFLLTEMGRTMAELTMDEKNLLSHRARALLAIKPVILSLL